MNEATRLTEFQLADEVKPIIAIEVVPFSSARHCNAVLHSIQSVILCHVFLVSSKRFVADLLAIAPLEVALVLNVI